MSTSQQSSPLISNPNPNHPKQVDQEQTQRLDVKPEHLSYLRKGVYLLKEKNQEEDYLLMLEKLIYLTLEFLKSHPSTQLNFDPYEEMIIYLETANTKAANAFKEGKYDESAKSVSSVVDLLSQENVHLLYETYQKLYQSKILAYNNLSCVYNALKKYDLSAKVITATLRLEEELAAEQYGRAELSIIGTYYNYSAILSQSKDHQKALEALEKGFKHLEKLENKKGLSEADKAQLKDLRVKGLINMGKEYENLNDKGKATGSYEKALVIAKELKKDNIVEKIEQSLADLKK
jgi:tetratricopeptide (TPR) repeat protein